MPDGAVATSGEEAARIAEEFATPVAVKALVPAGRRGKGGAVRLAAHAGDAATAARDIIGRRVSGYLVGRVYVERQVAVERELYLSFTFGSLLPRIVLSGLGGVEIEETYQRDPGGIIVSDVDPGRGLRPWDAVALWERAGVGGPLLPALAKLSASLFRAFQAADAITLEANPVAIDTEGNLSLVGAMLEIDDNALFRHPQWAETEVDEALAGPSLNERERQVIEANRRLPGGAIRYTELDGDIGLLVAGGGAGLLQHDMILAAGGRPANHTDISPGPSPEKIAVVLEAIFQNPRARSLLIGYNHLQMAPCDLVIEALLMAIRRQHVDPVRFPIVIRVFGPKEDEARRLAASAPGIQYLARGASLADAVRAVVQATGRARTRAVGR